MNLSVSMRTVRRVLNRCEFLDYRKENTQHRMTQRYKEQRVEWTEKHVKWDGARRAEVSYRDEKRFSLDGPDNLFIYWHDLRQEQIIFSKRQKEVVGLWYGTFFHEGSK